MGILLAGWILGYKKLTYINASLQNLWIQNNLYWISNLVVLRVFRGENKGLNKFFSWIEERKAKLTI